MLVHFPYLEFRANWDLMKRDLEFGLDLVFGLPQKDLWLYAILILPNYNCGQKFKAF
jgi:hypothetical protein